MKYAATVQDQGVSDQPKHTEMYALFDTSILLNNAVLIITKTWSFDSQLRPHGLLLRLFATELLFIVLSIDHVERDDVQATIR